MKLSKIFGLALVAVMMVLCYTSCSNDSKEEPAPPKDPIEGFNQGNMSFTEGAGEQSFSFIANEAWTISVATTKADEAWCKVSPTSGGPGNQVVKITTTENASYDDRSVTITLKAGSESKSFVVTQKQKDALLLTSDKVEIDQKGGTFTVEVKANVSYTATIGETCKDWVTEGSDTKALTTSTKTYSVAVNEDSEKREGSITFKAGALSETVHIYQAGGDIILLTQNEYHVDAAGENITVELKSNCEYEVEMPNVDWIHTTSTRGMSSHTLYYTIDANEGYDSREAKINYRNKANNVVETLTIIQAQKDAIILGKKEMTVKAEGETIEVKLSTNVEYEVVMPEVDWITTAETRGLTEHTLYYVVKANESHDSREAKISYHNKNNDIVETLTITQVQKDAIILGQKEISVKPEGETIEVKLSTNVEYEVVMPEVDWITTAETRGLTDYILHYTIKANETYDSREAKISYRNKANDIVETLTITQAQKEAIILGKKDISVKPEGETFEIKLSTNVEYEVIMPEVDWISKAETRGLTEHTLYFNVASNEGEDTRTATIKFCNKEKSLEDVLTIVQDGTLSATFHLANAGDLPTLTKRRDYKKLKLTGYINGTDVNAIRAMTDLEVLDISEASIVNGGDYYYSFGASEEGIYYYTSNDEIGDYMFYKMGIQSMLLPNSIKTIGERAFSNCENLSRINIPNSVTRIKKECFCECKELINVDLGNSISAIEQGAFKECYKLSSITIPDIITKIEDETFYACYKLEEVKLNNNIITIGNGAFRHCNALKVINIPNSVISIGESAFENCSLEDLQLGNNVITIGKWAFSRNNFTMLNIPDCVQEICEWAFYECKDLKTVNLGNGINSIKYQVFYGCSNLEHIKIPEKVKSIEKGAFKSCSSLKDVEFGNGITEIDEEAFLYCANLTMINIPEGTNKIEELAFGFCTELRIFIIPNSVTEMGKYICFRCDNLVKVVIGSGISNIYECDLINHNSVKEVYCYGATPPKAESTDFEGIDKTKAKLYTPKGCSQAYRDSEWGNAFDTIIEMEE